MAEVTYRVGVYCGKSRVDAVVVADGCRVVASSSQPAAAYSMRAVATVLRDVLAKAAVSPSSLEAVTVSTWQMLEALLHGLELAPVALVRLANTTGLPPGLSWPSHMQQALNLRATVLPGGCDADGQSLAALDMFSVRAFSRTARFDGFQHGVVSAVFSPLFPTEEIDVKRTLSEVFDTVTLSSQLGSFGLVEREDAAVLNASIRPLARRLVTGLQALLAELGCGQVPLFFAQSDGTMVLWDELLQLPVLTAAACEASVVVGACFLAHLESAVTVDVGPLSVTCGRRVDGCLSETQSGAVLAGVRTSLSAPLLFSVEDVRSFRSGSDHADAFASTSLNAATTGGPLPASAFLPAIAAGVSRLQSGREGLGQALPVILIGSEAVRLAADPLFQSCAADAGWHVVLPDNAHVAGAVGAALAVVSGRADFIADCRDGCDINQLLCEAEDRARTAATSAGAQPLSTSFTRGSVEPVLGLEGFVRVRGCALGPPDTAVLQCRSVKALDSQRAMLPEDKALYGLIRPPPATGDLSFDMSCLTVSIASSPPDVMSHYEWRLNETDLTCIALGAAVLCAGAESSHHLLVRAMAALRSGLSLRVVRPASVASSDTVLPMRYLTTALIMSEKAVSGSELVTAAGEVTALLDVSTTVLRGILCCDASPAGFFEPLLAAARLGLPVVDAVATKASSSASILKDYSMFKDKHPLGPCAIASSDDSTVIAQDDSRCASVAHLEEAIQSELCNMSLPLAVCFPPLSGLQVHDQGSVGHHSLTKAWRIGDALLRARAGSSSPAEAVVSVCGNGRVVFSGWVAQLRDNALEHRHSVYLLSGSGAHHGCTAQLTVRRDTCTFASFCVADSSDDISSHESDSGVLAVLDANTGTPYSTRELEASCHVVVIAISLDSIRL